MYTIGFLLAQAQGTPSGSASPFSSITTFLPIIAMVVIFYFLLIRPQQKKEKERKNMIAALQKGDRVLTVGGMYGVIDSIKDNEVVILKIGGNTKAEFAKSAIQTKVP